LPNEIILDVENKYDFDGIKEKLKEKGWNYEVWDTGSRGLHIVLKFENLAYEDEEVRNRIRKYVIDEFKTDPKLAKENQWVALEYATHFKTGKEKLMIEKVGDGNNFLSEDIIKYCRKEVEMSKDINLVQDEDFSKYLDEDPYLKYVLQNKIGNGGRNDMLFKNLAIGLVKCGLSRDDIRKIAVHIVKNCPGKHVAEFMGWVDKAMRGELTEYNKAELVQWSVLYGHPVLYKLVDDEQILNILSIKQLWDIIWESQIAQQPVWRDLCFYNLISTIIKEKEEDYRIHVIFSCVSSSGKDEGLNLVEKVLKKLGYKAFRPAEITDRTLVGSVNQWAIEYNTKKGLKEGDKGWREVRQYGLLANENSDWLAFGEAETVLKPGVHNKKIQLILRQAMDKRRKIEKGVSGIMFDIYTNATIMMTTYSMDKDIYKLLMNGLFQRALFYRKELSKKEHDAIRKHINFRYFDSNFKKSYKMSDYMNALLEKLKHMKLWYEENKHKIQTYENAIDTIEYRWKEYEKKYESLPKSDRVILDSIVRRAVTNLYKLLVLTAVWQMKTKLDIKDIDYCFSLLFACIDSVKDLVVSQNKYEKEINVALEILKGGSMSAGNLHKKLEDSLGVRSTATKNRIIKKLKRLGYITEFKDGKYTMYMLTDKGFEYIAER